MTTTPTRPTSRQPLDLRSPADTAQQVVPIQPSPRRNRRVMWSYGAVASIILVAISGGIWWWQTRDQMPANFFPKSVYQAVSFPLFYPANLPSGYKFVEDSLSSSNQAIVFALEKDASHRVVVTVQAAPPGLNFDEFNRKELIGAKEIITRSGPGVVGLYGDHYLGSLLAEKTWIIVNAKPAVSSTDVENITKTLTRFTP